MRAAFLSRDREGAVLRPTRNLLCNMKKRLLTALSAYAVLIALSAWLLYGKVFYVAIGASRIRVNMFAAVCLLYGGLILKTLIAHKAGWTFHNETPRSESGSKADHPDSSSAL